MISPSSHSARISAPSRKSRNLTFDGCLKTLTEMNVIKHNSSPSKPNCDNASISSTTMPDSASDMNLQAPVHLLESMRALTGFMERTADIAENKADPKLAKSQPLDVSAAVDAQAPATMRVSITKGKNCDLSLDTLLHKPDGTVTDVSRNPFLFNPDGTRKVTVPMTVPQKATVPMTVPQRGAVPQVTPWGMPPAPVPFQASLLGQRITQPGFAKPKPASNFALLLGDQKFEDSKPKHAFYQAPKGPVKARVVPKNAKANPGKAANQPKAVKAKAKKAPAPAVVAPDPSKPKADLTTEVDISNYTTAMIRNVPAKYTQAEFLDELMSLGLKIDLLYLPLAKLTGGNRTYGFVNFETAAEAHKFVATFDQYRFALHDPNEKAAIVTFAKMQGLENNIKFYRDKIERGDNGPWIKSKSIPLSSPPVSELPQIESLNIFMMPVEEVH